jgi:hypothetical protein
MVNSGKPSLSGQIVRAIIKNKYWLVYIIHLTLSINYYILTQEIKNNIKEIENGNCNY